MKTVCLVCDGRDAAWLEDYVANAPPDETVSVVAPSFEARLLVESLGLEHKNYET